MAWIDRQLPEGDEIFLDHVGYFAADLGSAGHQLGRLGFRISPVNVQYNADDTGSLVVTGTSNRLVLLERGFIEVLAATADTPLAGQLGAALARYAGFHVIALTHADMAAERARLTRAGFEMLDVVNLRRRVDTAAGERQMAYSILRTKPGAMAEGRVQMLTNHTPELLWTPGTTNHENKVDALSDLLICVDDPAEAASRYGRFTGRSANDAEGIRTIDLERGRIVLADRETAERNFKGLSVPDLPYVAGLALRSGDMAATRRVSGRAGISPLYADDLLVCIGPADALGAHLLFHAASVDMPWHALAASGDSFPLSAPATPN